jgi:hypothetical protein
MGLLSIPAIFLALAQSVLGPMGGVLSTTSLLDLGYRQMYNLQFNDAHKTFQGYEHEHPNDPLGPTSDGAAYVFDEFDRLGVLQSELFVDNVKFNERQKRAPDPAIRDSFNRVIANSQRLADAMLRRLPNDRNALLATVLNLGLQSDYLAMVEKNNLAALSYQKRAGVAAQKLLAVDPTCYDAYLAIGVENYILGLKPAPVRWLLRIYGAETDKESGIQKLQLTAEKGHYLLPFARLMLAVAALRDNRRNRARDLLQNLAQEFPNNQLYRRELSRLQ